MELRERQALITGMSMILIFAVYSMFIYKTYVAANPAIINSFKFWGTAFLVLIPVTIVAQIVIQIIFAILNKILTREDIPSKSDERDKLIELKSLRISHWTFTLGFLLAMASQAFEMQVWIMFVILIISGFFSGVISEFAKIWFYRKGI